MVDLTIEMMAEREPIWTDFPQNMRNTRNLTYRALYIKIDNKFRHSVTLVNQEIRRRRELVELQDNDSCEIDGSLHS